MSWPVSNLVAFESPGPLVIGPLDPLVLPSFRNSGAVKQGNRLIRRPCKGDKFEIEIFEAKRQNAGICGTCQKIFATWAFISIGRQCDSSSRICISPAQWISFCSSHEKMGNLWFSSFPCKHPPDSIHFSSSFEASVPNMVRACNRRERVGNMSTTATSSVGSVLNSSRTLSPPSTPLLTIREHVQHVNNGNKFRGPCVKLVKNAITPPLHPPVDHKRACATC